MLTLKQSPIAIILMLLACSLADGDPKPGKLIIALLIVFLTIIYVLVCNYINVKRHGGESSMCTVLGACPADTLTCEDCGEEIEPGEEIEIEVETYERGRRGTKIITVCARCYESLYQGGSDNF